MAKLRRIDLNPYLKNHTIQIIKKHVNNCHNPSEIDQSIQEMVFELYNVLQDYWLFGEINGKTVIRKSKRWGSKGAELDYIWKEPDQEQLRIVCSDNPHSHLLCPLKSNLPDTRTRK